MTATIIDGKEVAQLLRGQIRVRAKALADRGVTPSLAVMLIGDNPASALYVRNKVRACASTGISSQEIRLPATVRAEEVLRRIHTLNDDPLVHGILVQLPLPPHIPIRPVLEAIAAQKDVDGFNLYNSGGLVIGDTVFPPCTPYGVLKLLAHANVPLRGCNAVVVGASNIVGKPMALMLLAQEATVTVCHIATRDLAEHTRLADVLIVAAGKPKLIRADMVRPGAVVIDVGITRTGTGFVGDVDFDAVRDVASYITPVPGGVGPMTVTMLLENTVVSAERMIAARNAPMNSCTMSPWFGKGGHPAG